MVATWAPSWDSTLQSLTPAATWLKWALVSVYLLLLALIGIYGLHRYWLLWLCRRRPTVSWPPPDAWPRVTVQLPMFNESAVAQRVIDAACRLSYPPQLLEVQVLDDSNDRCRQIAAQRVAYWRQQGVDIHLLHRTYRGGFKAGALAAGLTVAKGELLAIFDADFVPEPDFLRQAVAPFADPTVGMVQARWTHLNADQSLLTASQGIYLDGHFLIEQAARNTSGRWINFNGTAGVWRKSAIVAAGGWQADTLTEDMDLSYRAQLAGWRFVYLPQLTCPAELPPTVGAFKSQQHRWTKGSIQTARKLLPAVLRAQVPLSVKVESFFHLTCPMVYLYISLLATLYLPVVYLSGLPWANLAWGAGLLMVGTVAASAFYMASQRIQGRNLLAATAMLPVLMALGVGIAFNNARAVIEGILGYSSPFIRTPKFAGGDNDAPPRRGERWMIPLELTMGGYMLLCATLSWRAGWIFASFPFLLLFAAGYLYVGLASLGLPRPRASTSPASAAGLPPDARSL
jgi:cellulose synthase/poly-beta-1,6-N-acetylglucosamine synthase-like glycosyltransferase